MHPVLFQHHLGPEPRPVFAYGAALTLALLVFSAGVLRASTRRGLDHGAVIAALGAAVGGAALGGIALSALVDLARAWPTWPPSLRPGLVFYGGLLGGFAGFAGLGRALGLPLRPLLDLAAIPAALAHAVGRVGCLLGGCCYGSHTALPWGIAFTHPLSPAATAAGGSLPRHPVQLYEAAGLCLLALVLRSRRLSNGRDGARFAAYLGGYALLRLATELLRGDPERGVLWGVLSTSQLISACLLGALSLVWLRARFVSTAGFGYTGRVRIASILRSTRGPAGAIALALGCALGAAIVRADDQRDGAEISLRGPDRVRIESGSFLMGSDRDDLAEAVLLCGRRDGADPGCRVDLFADEAPRRRVFVTRYAIDRTEVSNADYRRCVGAAVCLPSETSANDPRLGAPDMPVTGVGFAQAQAYCAFVGGRLPSEAEWERAARGGSDRRFPWGDFWSSRLANFGSPEGLPEPIDGYPFAAPVDAFPDGRSPHGLLNMAGNVWEWTADFYDAAYYEAGEAVDPRGPSTGKSRVIRGGSWRSPPHTLRVTQRAVLEPDAARPDVGFRCAY